jgi:hypothetical protein
MSLLAPPQIGQYGANAAAQYKQALQADRAQARTLPVRYANFRETNQIHNNLFAYVKAFQDTRESIANDSFTPRQIEDATGLQLECALAGQTERIIPFLDLNKDGRVDTPELATAILSIDGALATPDVPEGIRRPLDGTISQEKRAATEQKLLSHLLLVQKHEERLARVSNPPVLAGGGPPQSVDDAVAQADAFLAQFSQMGKTLGLSSDPSNNPFAFQPSVGADAVFGDRLPLLYTAKTGEGLLSPGTTASVQSILDQGLSGQNVADTFKKQNQDLIQSHIHEAYDAFQLPLKEIEKTENVQAKYDAFRSGQ